MGDDRMDRQRESRRHRLHTHLPALLASGRCGRGVKGAEGSIWPATFKLLQLAPKLFASALRLSGWQEGQEGRNSVEDMSSIHQADGSPPPPTTTTYGCPCQHQK